MSDENLKKLIEIIKKIESWMRNYLAGIDDSYKNYNDYVILERFCNSAIPKYIYEITELKELLDNPYVYELIRKDLESIFGSVKTVRANFQNNKASKNLSELVLSARQMQSVVKDLQMISVTTSRIGEVIEPVVEQALGDIKEKVGKIDSAILAIEQKETDVIYLKLSGKYEWEYIRNNIYFFLTLAIVTFLSFNQSMSIAEIAALGERELFIFITIKILLITLAITLCTLFLRRASHAKKLQDQAYQTHVEISAFPIHVRSLKEEDKHELVKELAMKYFGKELDQTQNDKIGDLMKDQFAVSTEIIKASAELVKARGGSTTPP